MEGADRRDWRAFRGTQSALTTFSGVSGIGSIHRVTGRPGFFMGGISHLFSYSYPASSGSSE